MSEIKLPSIMAEEIALCSEPLQGCSPDHIRRMIDQYKSDEAVATFMAAVHNKVGWLHHELNDPDNSHEDVQRYQAEYEVWRAMEKQLVAEIIQRLEAENATLSTDQKITGNGTYYIVKPFMERNGFEDGSGWWIMRSTEPST